MEYALNQNHLAGCPCYCCLRRPVNIIVDLSNIFEWAQQKLNSKGHFWEMKVGTYINLLGDCHKLCYAWVGSPISQARLYNMRHHMLECISRSYARGEHSVRDHMEFLNDLILPYFTVDSCHGDCTFLEIEEIYRSNQF